MGIAKQGGHAQYKEAIGLHNKDNKRDAGQDGMSVESFMHNYLSAIVQLMEEVHSANVVSCEESSGLLTALEATWSSIASLFSTLPSYLPGDSDAYASGYIGMKELLVKYNNLVKESSGEQGLQLLVVNELQFLEVVCIRLYSGPMYKR